MSVLIFIFVLVVLVVGHELGHFVAAKWAKMRVLEFGVGFPPKVFGKRFGSSETEYTLNWLPFGGFVRIFGEDPAESGPGAFGEQSKWKQALVLFAGPGANFVLAFLLTTTALMIGTVTTIEASERESARDVRVLVAEVVPDSPAERAGLVRGDQVLSLASGDERVEVLNPKDIQDVVARSTSDVTLTVRRSGEEQVVVVAPTTGLIHNDPSRRAIGVATALVGVVAYPPHEAVVRGLSATYENTVLVAVSLATLLAQAFTFSADLSQVAGPVGIASLTGEAATFGVGALLSFAALLSINLGIINLFPFPALDGGRLLFLGVEAATRRKIPYRVAGALNTVGFALLILLMVAVTVGDIGRLLS